MLSRLDRSGPVDYDPEKFTSLPAIAESRKLVRVSFGDPMIYSTVQRGVTPSTRSMINSLLIPFDSPSYPTQVLLGKPISELLAIYFLDPKSLEMSNSQSPLLKAPKRASLLRNWEDVFKGLKLVKEVQQSKLGLLHPIVDSGSGKIVKFLISLKDDTKSNL